ncbi:MAG: YtxH domain-containing protein [Candidatus Omnitrophica bacterium]|nr:YtxH domain-containing protein [Candidatus Omnitrophota bacterium]
MKDSRRQGRTFLTVASFVLGTAIGSIATLLYAPASGQVTRRRLALRVRNLQRKALRQLGQTKRVLANRAESVREAATEWIAGHVPHGNGRHPIRRPIRHATAR